MLVRDGLLIINKPQGLTSHDVVEEVRRRLSMRRIGHAGTLDPMARGVLVLLVGHATKYQQLAQAHRKWYETVIQLGRRTDTGDAWGLVLGEAPVPPVLALQVRQVLSEFVGPLTQVPPTFSAVKVRGRPLYWWARRGMPQVAKPKQVEIFAIELLESQATSLRCRIECSAGTYIRSLAEAIAARLGTVGHVGELTRLAVGSWTLDQACELSWVQQASIDDVWRAVRPLHLNFSSTSLSPSVTP